MQFLFISSFFLFLLSSSSLEANIDCNKFLSSRLRAQLLSKSYTRNEVRSAIIEEYNLNVKEWNRYNSDRWFKHNYEQIKERFNQKLIEQEYSMLWPAEAMSLRLYTGFSFRRINKEWRRAGADISRLSRRTEILSSLIVKALDKLPSYRGTVYRFVKHHPYLDAYLRGKVIQENNFLSTTQSDFFWSWSQHDDLGEDFVMLKITSKSGVQIPHKLHYAYLNGARYSEKEVLFSPGVNFKVINRYTKNISAKGKSAKATVIEMIEMD